jgi:hypothetical protein
MRTQRLIRAKALAIAAVAAFPFSSPLDAQSLSLLYAQDANCVAGETVSQAYEPAYQSFSVQLADDVTVPANDSWEIARVYARGAYFNGTGPAASVNVAFLADGTGAPGTPIASCNYVALTSLVDSAGEFTITLPSACQLSGGTVGTRYWLVVQARMEMIDPS